MRLDIGAINERITGWEKTIMLSKDGKDYRVIVSWTDEDGYAVSWLDDEDRFILTPSWADDITRLLAHARAHETLVIAKG